MLAVELDAEFGAREAVASMLTADEAVPGVWSIAAVMGLLKESSLDMAGEYIESVVVLGRSWVVVEALHGKTEVKVLVELLDTKVLDENDEEMLNGKEVVDGGKDEALDVATVEDGSGGCISGRPPRPGCP